MDDRRSSFSLQAWLARLWAQGLPCPARVGCRPSSDGVQGWLLRCAVDAGWLICVASRSHSSARLGWKGGWWEKNAATSKPEIDEAGRQGSRESTALFESGMLSFINIKIPNLEPKHALELCSLLPTFPSCCLGYGELGTSSYPATLCATLFTLPAEPDWYLGELGQLGS